MKKWIFLFCCFLIAFSYAGVRPVATFSVGGDSVNPNMRQFISIVRPIQNEYQGRHANTEFVTGGFIGLEFPFISWFLKRIEIVNPLFLQVGGSYYYTNVFQASGFVYQTLNPSPVTENPLPSRPNFDYFFNIQNQRAFLEGKLLGLWPYNFDGFVSWGLGVSQNKAYHYNEFPRGILSPPPMVPGYSNHTTTTAAYLVGVGIEKEIYNNAKVGIFRIGGTYRYVSLGLARLGPAPLQVEQNNLFPTLGVQVHADEFLLQLTYVGPYL